MLPRRVLLPAGWPVPEGRGLALVAVRPAPLFPWYAVWRTASPHPLVYRLVRAMHQAAGGYDLSNGDHWLPAAARGG